MTKEKKDKIEKKKISSYREVHNKFVQLHQANTQRACMYSEILGLKYGKPPIDEEEMKEQGIEDMPNVNNRAYKAEQKPILEDFIGTVVSKNLIDIKVSGGTKQENYQVSMIASQAFSRVLVRETPWMYESKALANYHIDLGIGALFAYDPSNPEKFKHIDAFSFLYPKDCSPYERDIPCLGIMFELPIHELYERYQKIKDLSEKELEKVYWSKSQLERILYDNALYDNKPDNVSNYSESLKEILNDTIANQGSCSTLFSGKVKISALLNRENSGRVSLIFIDPKIRYNSDAKDDKDKITYETDEEGKDKDLLFYAFEVYKNMDHGSVAFPFEDGIRYLHESFGFGEDTFHHFDDRNRLENAATARAELNGIPMMEFDGGDLNDLKDFKLNPHRTNVLPKGLRPVEYRGNGNIQEILQVHNHKIITGRQNNPYLETNDVPHNPINSTQRGRLTADFLPATRARGTNLRNFLDNLGRFYRSYFSKVIFLNKDNSFRKSFIYECEQLGLPNAEAIFDKKLYDKWNDKTCLPMGWWVEADKILNASNLNRSVPELRELLAEGFQLPRSSQRKIIRLYFRAKLGEDMAEYIYNDEDDMNNPMMGHHFASLAANQLEDGKQVIWADELPHYAYIEVMMGRLEEHVSEYEQADSFTKENIIVDIARKTSNLAAFLASSIKYVQTSSRQKVFNETINQQFFILLGKINGIYANARKRQEAIARQKVELQNAQQGNIQDPKVLKILVDKELALLKRRDNFASKMQDKRISLLMKQAELEMNTMLKEKESGAKIAIEEFEARGRLRNDLISKLGAR